MVLAVKNNYAREKNNPEIFELLSICVIALPLNDLSKTLNHQRRKLRLICDFGNF